MIDLAANGDSYAAAINKNGLIVGVNNGSAVAWFDGKVQDLNQLVPALPNNLRLIFASDVNSFGQIVGGLLDSNSSINNSGVFVLTPIPEAETWLFLGTGIAMLMLRKRPRITFAACREEPSPAIG
jgi:hypothetical protein